MRCTYYFNNINKNKINFIKNLYVSHILKINKYFYIINFKKNLQLCLKKNFILKLWSTILI
jgi:hypothetical protein